MPIYEYRCSGCGHELEALQAINDPPLSECPACSEPQLHKRISTVAFRLKGSGWYETDFKKDKRRNLAGEGGGEGKDSGKGDGAKGEGSESKGNASGEGSGKKDSSGKSEAGGKSGESSGKTSGGQQDKRSAGG